MMKCGVLNFCPDSYLHFATLLVSHVFGSTRYLHSIQRK
jgi:hypothetical protein